MKTPEMRRESSVENYVEKESGVPEKASEIPFLHLLNPPFAWH
jgi:hypothetical protein